MKPLLLALLLVGCATHDYPPPEPNIPPPAWMHAQTAAACQSAGGRWMPADPDHYDRIFGAWPLPARCEWQEGAR